MRKSVLIRAVFSALFPCLGHYKRRLAVEGLKNEKVRSDVTLDRKNKREKVNEGCCLVFNSLLGTLQKNDAVKWVRNGKMRSDVTLDRKNKGKVIRGCCLLFNFLARGITKEGR